MPPNAENGCCEVLAAAKNGELRVTWSILIDGPLSKAARAEVDRKYRVTSDLP